MDKSRIQLMENEPVKSAILKLAIPTMVAMAVQLIYNLTDTFFIGQTKNELMVAAIAIAGPIFMFAQSIGNIFAIGSSSYISRKLGEKEYEEAKHTSSVAVYTAIVGAVLVMAALLIFMVPLLRIIGTSPDTVGYTADYLTVVAAFTPALVLQVALAGLVRSEGATNKAMIGMCIGIGTNIVLDPIFILDWGLGLGTAGAAWATVIGNVAGASYFLYHFLSKRTMLSIKPQDFKPSWRIYSETFKIGLPSALSSFVMCVSFILVNVLASKYGDHVVAGNGITMRIAGMCIMIVIGLAQGFQPFAGYCYGAKKFHRLDQGFKLTMLYGTILSLIFLFIFMFLGERMVGIFIDHEPTVQAGWEILKAFMICVPFFGVQMTLLVAFQATGMAVRAMIVSLGRQCIVYMPLLFILNHLFGFQGFIYAQPIADIVTTLLAALLSISFLKRIRLLQRQQDDMNGEMHLA